MQVQGAAADLEADRDRQLVEFMQVLAVGEEECRACRAVPVAWEWSWQRAQGRPSRTPAALRRGDDRQAAATGRRAPGCAARWRPAGRPGHCSDRRSGMARRCVEGAAAGVPAASRDRRRARAPGAGRRVPGSDAGPSQRVVAPGSGRTRPGRERRCLRAPARPVAEPPAGWRRLPPAGSARASGPAPEPGRKRRGRPSHARLSSRSTSGAAWAMSRRACKALPT